MLFGRLSMVLLLVIAVAFPATASAHGTTNGSNIDCKVVNGVHYLIPINPSASSETDVVWMALAVYSMSRDWLGWHQNANGGYWWYSNADGVFPSPFYDYATRTWSNDLSFPVSFEGRDRYYVYRLFHWSDGHQTIDENWWMFESQC